MATGQRRPGAVGGVSLPLERTSFVPFALKPLKKIKPEFLKQKERVEKAFVVQSEQIRVPSEQVAGCTADDPYPTGGCARQKGGQAERVSAALRHASRENGDATPKSEEADPSLLGRQTHQR